MKMASKETQIIIAGFGGQGIVLTGNVIARAAVIEGKNVTGMVSYGVEMRGGTANATVIVSDDEIASPFVETPNAAIIMNQPSLDKFESVLEKDSVAILNTSMVTKSAKRKDLDIASIDATNIAREMGNARVANIVTLGAFIKKTGLLKSESIEKAIADLFSDKKPELVEINIKALKLGMEKCS
jgi:2-oxoglutarate ferredoxin oxidoreductase subunit gamma